MQKIQQKPITKLYRNTWEEMGLKGSPITRIIPNKKGKGSYKRNKIKIKQLINNF